MTQSDDAEPREVLGRPLRCQHCENDAFRRVSAEIPSRARRLLPMGWLANPDAEAYVCSRCGLVQWFVRTE